ncbi:GspE/PulE family protein [Vulcanococcus sp. Clear-D1]|uniref:GspE/PulE family protein n=1 Tax=Vulcanococcus sp. Clear-D1 TaxID=2766970 RepID=UPI00198FBA06|nr:GspE/PulE family protein [Vulcanococcus sp. Clear-D1]MBD1193892.1 type II/IV secretion system protein [Vulcanococcus sp. Clear-D1]
MTLTPTRPVPAAASADQQRLEVELLLGEAVLTRQELQAAGEERWRWAQALPQERCHQLGCLPVAHSNGEVVLAIPSHWGAEQRQHLQKIAAAASIPISLRLALPDELEAALETAAAAASPPAPEPTPKPTPSSAPARPAAAASLVDDLQLEETLEAAPAEDFDDLDVESSLSASNASPVVSLVDRILVQALQRSASDIHLEPQDDGLLIRLRQDGVLEQLDKLPKNLTPAVTSRLKIMADLDIAERRLPQDGRIRRRYQGKLFDLRVSTLPTRYGEKVCMRLLDSGATHLGLDKLITDPVALASVREMGGKPFGMLLVTGPTGSGKSTTLYSLLAERNDPGVNISTVEDPIEYTLKGISQTQVNREKGYDFALALRAFMRQDPDVLLVGETRDQETAKTAIEAALTGHLVLTTLHCNDAPSAIARLAEMGVEPFMVSASLMGIVSQRLVRRVCPDCRQPYHPSEQELGRFGLFASNEQAITFFKARRHQGDGETVCPTCQGLGYRGRVGVYEVLRINEILATAIAQQASTDRLRKLAIEAGMKTLLGYGLDLVRQGHTTLEEIERMILTDSSLESERRAKALHTITCGGCGAGMRDEWLECPYCLTPRGLS